MFSTVSGTVSLFYRFSGDELLQSRRSLMQSNTRETPEWESTETPLTIYLPLNELNILTCMDLSYSRSGGSMYHSFVGYGMV
jgi:hypothetical protein